MNPKDIQEALIQYKEVYMAFGWSPIGDYLYVIASTEKAARQQYEEEYRTIPLEGLFKYSIDGYKNP